MYVHRRVRVFILKLIIKLLSILPMIYLAAELTGVSDPDPNLAESWIRIRLQDSQNGPKNNFVEI